MNIELLSPVTAIENMIWSGLSVFLYFDGTSDCVCFEHKDDQVSLEYSYQDQPTLTFESVKQAYNHVLFTKTGEITEMEITS